MKLCECVREGSVGGHSVRSLKTLLTPKAHMMAHTSPTRTHRTHGFSRPSEVRASGHLEPQSPLINVPKLQTQVYNCLLEIVFFYGLPNP